MRRLLFFLVSIFLAAMASGQPDMSRGQMVGEWEIFPDTANSRQFYFLPGPLEIATAAGGRPEASFLMMRQSGTNVDGRANQFYHNSLFQCRVRMTQPSPSAMDGIREHLRGQYGANSPYIDPLPLSRMELAIVLPSAEGNDYAISGISENAADESAITWSERMCTVKLGDADAQLLDKALSIGQTTMHIRYAFYAKDSLLVRAESLPLSIDLKKYPEMVRKLDINAQAPPGYALLEVRCYDFNNELRSDLFAKRIEVEAEGVSGQKVRAQRTFFASQPDVYVQMLRFPHAVKLDRPLRYRVVELSEEKPPIPGNWKEHKNWNAMIDATEE